MGKGGGKEGLFLEIILFTQDFFHLQKKLIWLQTFRKVFREFPGGPVMRIWCFHCWGLGSIPGQGTEIPQEARYSQKQKPHRDVFKIIFV